MSQKQQAEKADPDVNSITQALAAPFRKDEVHWKPQTISGNRALVVAFVDARVVQDRLDDVLGVMGWQDSYECLPDGAVVCRLKVRIGQEWITKEDVGGQSEQPDEGDRRKAAFSDALKRVAVKYGVGRYLYRQKPQWMDYDPQKRRIVGVPTLAEEIASQRPENGLKEKAPAQQPSPAKDADQKTLAQRLEALSASADAAGAQPPGTLVADAVSELCPRLGDDYRRWPESAAEEVMAWAKARYAELVGPLPVTEQQARKVESLLLTRQGATWAKLKGHLKTHATKLTALTRAEYAEALKVLEAMPLKEKKAGKGAA